MLETPCPEPWGSQGSGGDVRGRARSRQPARRRISAAAGLRHSGSSPGQPGPRFPGGLLPSEANGLSQSSQLVKGSLAFFYCSKLLPPQNNPPSRGSEQEPAGGSPLRLAHPSPRPVPLLALNTNTLDRRPWGRTRRGPHPRRTAGKGLQQAPAHGLSPSPLAHSRGKARQSNPMQR